MNVFMKLSLLSLVSLSLNASSLDRITVLTEHWPPYNIANKGKLSGLSVDLFELMLKRNNSKITRDDFILTSWKKAYLAVKSRPRMMVLTMSRNKIRENKFKWVGPIDSKTSGLLAKKSKKIKIKSMGDLSKYKIAVVKDYSTHEILRKAGLSKNLVVLGGVRGVHKALDKLKHNEVDIYSSSNINYILSLLKSNEYEVVKKYKENQLYFAFNKGTSDEIINQLQKTLDELKSEGVYQKIKSKYIHVK